MHAMQKEPKTDLYKGVLYTINRGEFLYSVTSYSAKVKDNRKQIKELITLLKNDGMIEQVNSLGRNMPTIYKIINYEVYNSFSTDVTTEHIGIKEVEANSKPLASHSQSTDDLLNATKEYSNTEIKKDKKPSVDYRSVFDISNTWTRESWGIYSRDAHNAMDKAMKAMKCDVEYLKITLDRHTKVVFETKDSDSSSLTLEDPNDFFGQKAHKATHLICAEYDRGVKYERYKYLFEKPVKAITQIKRVEIDDGWV